MPGDPRDEILFNVKKMGVNLLILGARGLSALKRAFLGSVSDYLSRHVSIPMVIVHLPKGHKIESPPKKAADTRSEEQNDVESSGSLSNVLQSREFWQHSGMVF
jgi:hypothetical protein